jgi:pyruvate kinase
VDAVSQSFVEGPADIDAVRKASEDLGYHPFIIAKIERSKALDNIDAILDTSDGIMVARGDLGVEVPIEEIPVLQKRLIRLANKRAKPVITATQMLESMADNRRPTRAEVTDVANAIIDGTDCVMLSAESAVGKYPVDAVAMLAKIAASVEAHRPPIAVKELYRGIDLTGKMQPEHLIAIGVEACLEYESPTAVFVPTHTGARARSIARFRFPVWTAALCSLESTCQHLQFSSGVYPMHTPEQPKNWNDFLKRWLSEHGIVEKIAILTEGPSTEHPERNNRMEIIDLRPRSKRGS